MEGCQRTCPEDGLYFYKSDSQTPPNTPLLSPKTHQPTGSAMCENKDGGSVKSGPTSQPYVKVSTAIAENGEDGRTSDLLPRCHSKPPNFLGLAVLVSLCNCPLGVLATIFACLSSGDYSRGDIDGARNKGQVAKWLSIIGFVSSVLIAAMVAMYFLVIERNIVRSYEELLEG